MRIKLKFLIIIMAKMVVADGGGGGVHHEDHGVDLTDYLSKDQSDYVFHDYGKDDDV